jgi:aspartyl-tRNA(Asn)/glutamyl-tRNA(Gln) amidotransferase subunit C
MIDLKTIQHIAKLARLNISSAEAEEYSEQLAKALQHFKQVESINTEGVEPLVTPTDIELFLREDQNIAELTTDEVLQNAPDRAGNLFKVPPVV